MRTRTTALVIAGALTTGSVGALALVPASAATGGNPVTSRLAHLKADLSGLVSDGTLTQAQADKVAATLDAKLPKGPRDGFGRGHGLGHRARAAELAAAAKALGLSESALRDQLRAGKSLAQVAAAQKVDVATLVKALVAVAQKHLAAAVTDGRLTQAQADKLAAGLTARITERVNAVRPPRPAGPPPGAGADEAPDEEPPGAEG
jgi:hypothetical protein